MCVCDSVCVCVVVPLVRVCVNVCLCAVTDTVGALLTGTSATASSSDDPTLLVQNHLTHHKKDPTPTTMPNKMPTASPKDLPCLVKETKIAIAIAMKTTAAAIWHASTIAEITFTRCRCCLENFDVGRLSLVIGSKAGLHTHDDAADDAPHVKQALALGNSLL